ncbi:hypothetical protein BJ138DRAFT_1121005 [Hygrophoropsis aurantiaca]|uniref:Uncharacterized protein n=1 Tax=Hygrophoropsis aurantiaca TaxID=72124 RepID=A0ACB7ZRA0_9AGAM|nr:hypothetical protein BJ138DRAFT_1121005 [Hygrophoropsis aurantiaca]
MDLVPDEHLVEIRHTIWLSYNLMSLDQAPADSAPAPADADADVAALLFTLVLQADRQLTDLAADADESEVPLLADSPVVGSPTAPPLPVPGMRTPPPAISDKDAEDAAIAADVAEDALPPPTTPEPADGDEEMAATEEG